MYEATSQALDDLVRQLGQRKALRPEVCKIQLLKACPDDAAEVSVLLAALRHGIPDRALAWAPHLSPPELLRRLADQLSAYEGIPWDDAYVVSHAWCHALGLVPSLPDLLSASLKPRSTPPVTTPAAPDEAVLLRRKQVLLLLLGSLLVAAAVALYFGLALHSGAFRPRAGARVRDGHAEGYAPVVPGMALSPDGGTLAAPGRRPEEIVLYDVQNLLERVLLVGHEAAVGALAFNADGTILVSAARDLTLRVWNTATGAPLSVLRGHRDSVTGAALSPDGRTVVSCSADATIRVWDALSGTEVRQIRAPAALWCLSLSEDGGTAAVGGEDGVVRLYRTLDGGESLALGGHSEPVHSVAFVHMGGVLLAGGREGVLRRWDTARGREVGHMAGLCPEIWALALSRDERNAAVSGTGGKIWELDLAEGRVRQINTESLGTITGLAFGPNGDDIACVSSDRIPRLFRTKESP